MRNLHNGDGYAITFDGHGTFTPGGRADHIADVDAHNKALEMDELTEWATCPERWHVYVTTETPDHGMGTMYKARVGCAVTTFLGATLGTITRVSDYRNNLGARITSITFRGTNGATYHGRYGADWQQLCRVRRSNV